MENAEIARVFEEIADLLELTGGDRFRTRSYRNASVIVEGLAESLSALYEQGADHLKGIPGIGESLKAKIIELLTTGKCAYHEELLKQMPAGMLDILKVSGIGPKKAALIHKELGVSSVDELEKAAETGSLRELAGLGETSEQKILKAVKEFKSRSGRYTLPVAVRLANLLSEYIGKVPGVIKVEAAGSLRRWKEDIGDIDILAACDGPSLVMESFAAHPEVKEVLARGETKTSVVLRAGIQVDLRVVEKDSFGAALQYFTGSKAHNVALRDRAKRMGLKISEYGVYGEPGGKRVAGKTEEDVYGAVGLAWIPPELRENRGEIEAAEEGRLPKLLSVKDIRGDLHSHTTESDGGFSLEDMAGAAMKRGYEYLAVTDHSKAVGIAHGLDEKRVIAQIEAIDAFNARLKKAGKKFTVLKGTEVDIRADGTLDHPERLLKRLDCVVASVHSSFRMSSDEMTARVVRAIRSGLVNIIGHPTGRLIGEREPIEIDMEAVMDEAKKYGVAFELNSYPERLDLNDTHLRLARKKGLLVAVSTDAHSTAHFENINYGVHIAARGWLEKKDVLNTRPLKELLKILKRQA